jgi:SAM-dependent methyltransferase
MPQLPSVRSSDVIGAGEGSPAWKDEFVIRRYFTVAERDHEIQNPTSEEKLRLLGERLRLGRDSRVLDIASGRGGPALLLAGEFGCRVEGIEIAPEFHTVAVERAQAAGVDELVSFRLGDASPEEFETGAYDAVLCLGASFVWGSLAGTLDALEPTIRDGGHVAVGEPYLRALPLPADYEQGHGPYTTLEGTVAIMDSGALRTVSVIASSDDDWDRYETLHWRAVEEWLATSVDDPEAAEVHTRHERYKRDYLRYGCELLGWAIFVGWKRPA